MARKDTTTDKDKTGKIQGNGQVLARFEAEGYRFNPHTSGWARWVFNHSPGIILSIFLITVVGWFMTARSVTTHGQLIAITDLLYNIIYFHLPFTLSIWVAISISRDITGRAPKYLRELEKAGRLKLLSNGEAQDSHPTRSIFNISPKSWQTYADDLENVLHSKWALALFMFWIVVVAILGNMFANTFNVYTAELPWMRFSYAMMLGGTGLYIAYHLGYTLWTLYVTATYIRKLPSACLLDIEPGHGEGSGGFKRLGDLCLELASIPIVPLLMIATYNLTGNTAASVIEFQLSMYIGLFILIAAVIVNFFWPLLDIHRFMLQAKRNYQDAAAVQMGRVEQQLRDLFQKEPLDEKQAKVLEGRLEQLKKAYPAVQQYPTWPFTVHTVIYLAASQVLPILSAGKVAIEVYEKFN